MHAQLLRTSMFQRALSALRNTAHTLAVLLPPPSADRAATESYVRSSVEATADSSEECAKTLVAAQ